MRKFLFILFVPMMMSSMQHSRYFDQDPQVQAKRTLRVLKGTVCVTVVELTAWFLGCPPCVRGTLRSLGCGKCLYDGMRPMEKKEKDE